VGVSGWGLAAYIGIVLVGGLVQDTAGFGANLIAAPVVAVAAPGAVPGALVLMSLPLTVTMAAREHDAIDRPGVLCALSTFVARHVDAGRLRPFVHGLAAVAAVAMAEGIVGR